MIAHPTRFTPIPYTELAAAGYVAGPPDAETYAIDARDAWRLACPACSRRGLLPRPFTAWTTVRRQLWRYRMFLECAACGNAVEI